MSDQQDMRDAVSERIASGATAAMMAAALLVVWALCWYMRPQPAQADVFDQPAPTLAFQTSMTTGF
jgi:hypothetical protein